LDGQYALALGVSRAAPSHRFLFGQRRQFLGAAAAALPTSTIRIAPSFTHHAPAARAGF